MGESNLVLLEQKFGISELSGEIQNKFYKAIKDYLNHGRTYDYLVKQIDKLLEFTNTLGLSNENVISILGSFPGILNSVDDLYKKYLFLGIVENEDNSLRKTKLINKPNDFRVGLNKIHARFHFMIEMGYDNITWNSLVHATDEEFASIFVIGKYNKPYRIYSSIEDVLKKLSSINTNIDFDDVKSLAVNKELVENYESKSIGK